MESIQISIKVQGFNFTPLKPVSDKCFDRWYAGCRQGWVTKEPVIKKIEITVTHKRKYGELPKSNSNFKDYLRTDR